MALQNESKLRVYQELKWEVGFDRYLEYRSKFYVSLSGPHNESSDVLGCS